MKNFAIAAIVAAGISLSGAAAAKDIVATATDAGKFTILLRLTKAAGMDSTLQGSGPFTVFAPTDDAFNALPPGMLDKLMKPENAMMLGKMLGYHVLAGTLTTADALKVADGKTPAAAATIVDAPVVITSADGALMVNDAHVVEDVTADNGVVHVIDKVLIPPMPVQPKL